MFKPEQVPTKTSGSSRIRNPGYTSALGFKLPLQTSRFIFPAEFKSGLNELTKCGDISWMQARTEDLDGGLPRLCVVINNTTLTIFRHICNFLRKIDLIIYIIIWVKDRE